MNGVNGQGPRFWPTVWLLLKSARRRYQGRRVRQQQLMNQRAGKNATDWGALGTALGVLFMAVVHVLAAATLYFSVIIGERMAVEQSGKIVVSRRFLDTLTS